MKISGKGVVVILIFLVGIPVIVDLILAIAVPGGADFGMSRFLISSYIGVLPFYILYLVLAFAILYTWNKWKKREGNTKNNDRN